MGIETKCVPFPLESTWPLNCREPSLPLLLSVRLFKTPLIRNEESHPLKLVPVTWKDPFAFTATVIAESIASLISLTFAPHGLPELGRWTSARTAVPLTPKAGVTIAWEATWWQRAKTRTLEAKILENMVIFKINGMMTREGGRDGRYQSLKVNESQKRREEENATNPRPGDDKKLKCCGRRGMRVLDCPSTDAFYTLFWLSKTMWLQNATR